MSIPCARTISSACPEPLDTEEKSRVRFGMTLMTMPAMFLSPVKLSSDTMTQLLLGDLLEELKTRGYLQAHLRLGVAVVRRSQRQCDAHRGAQCAADRFVSCGHESRKLASHSSAVGDQLRGESRVNRLRWEERG